MSLPQSSQRLGYIDALRALAMLMVVYEHVRIFSYGIDPEPSVITMFFNVVMVPLFFFVSGYVSYKDPRQKTLYQTAVLTFKRAVTLLVPTLFFFALKVILDYDIPPAKSFPSGYWFTVALCFIIILYNLTAFISRNLSNRTQTVIVLAIGIILYFARPFIPDIPYTCSAGVCLYFITFVIGILARKYSDVTSRLISNGPLLAIAILSAATLMILRVKCPTFRVAGISGITYSITGLLLIYILYAAFAHAADYWNRPGFIQRTFSFVGRRTLDLYMIHYFFIPALPALAMFFSDGTRDAVDFTVTAVLTAIITFLSLLTSALIRTSPILAHWLFGAHYVAKEKIKCA